MNNPIAQPSPTLRIEAVSINCIMREASIYAVNGNLLIIAESLTAHYVEYLLLMRLTILLHMTRRNAQSITMITDERGNVISGGNNGGKSHISYTPYGSIHRTDSSGPDITRFKFTGQEEDKESGLLYYKARYYDPMLGRFLQADSVIMPESTFGMNRYMYVEGNPVRFKDDTGHIPAKTWMKMAVNYYVAKEYGIAFVPKNAIQNITREAHRGRKKYLAAYMGSQMSGQMNLSPEQGAALGMYAAAGKTNIGKDISRGAGVMAFAMGLNVIINEPGLNDEQRAQRLTHLYVHRKTILGKDKAPHTIAGALGETLAGVGEVVVGITITIASGGSVNGLPMVGDGLCRINRGNGGKGECDGGSSDGWGGGGNYGDERGRNGK